MGIYCIKKPTNSTTKSMSQVLKYCLTIAATLFLIATVKAQSDTVSLNMTDVSVETAFNEIRNQTDVSFIFNNEEINQAPKISVSVEKVTDRKCLGANLKKYWFDLQKGEQYHRYQACR